MIACWGASFAAVKAALEALTAPALVTARFAIGAACLLPFVLLTGPARLRSTAPAGLTTGAALGAGYLLQAAGMRETSASVGGFLAGLIPILVAAGGWFLLGARLGGRGKVGLVLGLAGLVVLVWPEGGDATNTTRGIVLQCLASVSFAAHVLLMSHHGARVPALPFCLWQLVLVTAAAALFLVLDGLTVRTASPEDVPLGWLLAFLGVVATAAGIAGQSRIQPLIPPLHVALLFATQPLFAGLVGWTALGDALGPRELAGAALIVAGVVVTSLDRARAPAS